MPILAVLLSAAQIQAPAPTQAQASPAPAAPTQEVVVVARRQAAWQRCLTEGCPPEVEVEAAMDAAAALFRNGRYNDAYTLLKKAVDRNRKYEARMPGKMSDLYSTLADVSKHWGQTGDYQAATWSSARVLRSYVSPTSPAALYAGLRVGDMLATTRSAFETSRSRTADPFYEKLARDATAAGRPRLAALITFRRAWLAFAWRQMPQAKAMLDEVMAQQGNDPKIAALVRALRIQIATVEHDDATAERLMAAWQTDPGVAPVLISEPGMFAMEPLKLGTSELVVAGAGQGTKDVRWADIGFWVRPSGHVEQAEVLRPTSAAGWAKPLAERITERRYVPLAEEPGSPGIYQIERYSLRREFDTRTGSRIIGRLGDFSVIKTPMPNSATSNTGTSPATRPQ